MEKLQLLDLIEGRKKPDQVTLNQLKSYLIKYPFCQTARMLFLKNVKAISQEQFERESVISGLFIGDHGKLHLYLNSEIATVEINETDKQVGEEEKVPVPVVTETVEELAVESNESEDILDLDEDGAQEDVKEIAPPEIEIAPSYSELLDLDDDNAKENAEHSSGQFDLINKFIDENPRITPQEPSAEIVDVSGDSVVEKDDIYTEKLAKIYVLQKNYAKAIEVYKKLSLKIPEKNTYFAEQIENLKEKLNKN